MTLEQRLSSGFEAMGLSADDEMLRRYRVYYEYLEEINQVMNLTAISGEKDVAELHFLDCAALLTMQSFAGKSVIDVGTGAGFPGLALKIACPELELTLLDSLDKRVNFLKNTCERLGFDNVNCIHARAEEIPAGLRQGFDFAVSRAVARLNLLCELCLPYVKKGGMFIAMKGPELDVELEEIILQQCVYSERHVLYRVDLLLCRKPQSQRVVGVEQRVMQVVVLVGKFDSGRGKHHTLLNSIAL